MQALPHFLSHPQAQPPAAAFGQLSLRVPQGARAKGVDPARSRLLPGAPGEKARSQSETLPAGAWAGFQPPWVCKA